ncbi:MAG: carbohydrate-binding family 9-like protein [Verrucomicrobiota bacterium]
MKKTYTVKRLGGETGNSKNEIDSPLPAASWAGAEVLADFAFPWTDAKAPETVFRALWDEQYFYFRYEVLDLDLVLGEGIDSMEKVMGSDRVEIFFTTSDDLKLYYGLEMDPRGEILAYETRYHRQFNWDWTCPGLQVWPSLQLTGYELEGRIPLQTFRDLGCWFEKGGQACLKAGLFRAEFSHVENAGAVDEDWISWVNPGGDVPDFHVPAAFGELQFVAD